MVRKYKLFQLVVIKHSILLRLLALVANMLMKLIQHLIKWNKGIFKWGQLFAFNRQSKGQLNLIKIVENILGKLLIFAMNSYIFQRLMIFIKDLAWSKCNTSIKLVQNMGKGLFKGKNKILERSIDKESKKFLELNVTNR